MDNKGSALGLLGELQIILERRDAAFNSFQMAIDTRKIILQIAPDNVETFEYIGLGLNYQANIYFEEQEYAKAVDLFQQAIEWYNKALDINPKLESTVKEKIYVLAKLDEIKKLLS